MRSPSFQNAKPIWLKGLTEEMNITAGFRCVFKARQGSYRLRLAGATIYRVRLNGVFIGHGPARCGHGYYRVDELELPVVEGENLLTVEVAGYNANSFAYLDQPSFLQAELLANGKSLAATGARGFDAYRLRTRVQRVQRYSFQRPFTEGYRLSPRSDDWCTKLAFRKRPELIEVLAPRKLVARGVPYSKWETRQPVAVTASGTLRPIANPSFIQGREWKGPLPHFKAFPEDARTLYPRRELEAFQSTVGSRKTLPCGPGDTLALKPRSFKVMDLGTNLTGFIGLHVECDEAVDLYLAFDEVDTENGDVSLTRYNCANVIKYALTPGRYALESIEPYTLKFLKLIALGGSCQVSGVYLREYASPDAQRGHFAASDHQLGALFEAARQTFRQNSTDIFMDCPGRERAGWLCDSFFTARAERDLCGDNQIERNFFENYLLPKRYPHQPKGMLPMCYPSDHTDGNFIPNWAMWFVIELEEYLYRSGDREMIDALQSKVYGLIEYFKPFLNSDGLLERLEKWIFIEWSEAAKFVQDVSYPSNMVYAGMLDAAGMLYGDDALMAQAEAVRQTIREQSYDGTFFVDNALRRDDGTLELTRNRTETCQYYAFFFEVATPKSHRALWKKLREVFGPDRDAATQYPEIHPSNAFIGFFLRLDVLSRYRESGLILDQLYKHYLPMAQATGTLWEHKDTAASCNHGFAAHVAHILYRDVLGIHFDPVSKHVEFRVPDIELDWCSGRIPVGDEWIDAKWVRSGDEVEVTLSVPQGFQSKIVK